MADVIKSEAKKHFNAGGTVSFIDYQKGTKTDLSRQKVADMFKVDLKEVKFEDVMKYGPMHNTKEPAFRLVEP